MSTNFLDMSDDEFMNLPQTTEAETIKKPEDNDDTPNGDKPDATTDGDDDLGEAQPGDATEETGDDTPDDPDTPDDGEDKSDGDSTGSDKKDDTDTGNPSAPADGDKAGDKGKKPADNPKPDASKPDDKTKADDKSKAAEETKAALPVDYKAAYEKIMKPFKANGREIKLNSPDEVVQLMQRGAGYTKKMQQLQPSLKIIRMLQDNGLHDENIINSAIDVLKGDKAAIVHFLKEKGIDPLDIDPEAAKGYKQTNHRIADDTMALHSTLEEVNSSEHGTAIVRDANTWDAESKKAIFKNPQVLNLLADHREQGYYDQIVGEIEKQKALGNSEIARLPFLHAYKIVGDAMEEKGMFGTQDAPAKQPEQPKQPEVLARQPAPRKPTATNGDRVKAATSTQNTPRRAVVQQNPLAMSDEEFMKTMGNQV